MIQYLYFISYPIFHPKEIKNKIKMFHIFQQTARVSLIKTTNIDKLVTLFKLLVHIFILTPQSKVKPWLRQRFNGSYNYTFLWSDILKWKTITSLQCISISLTAGYYLCPQNVQCPPGCTKIDTRGCKLCACGPGMYLNDQWYLYNNIP